jgi:hypothetical protein
MIQNGDAKWTYQEHMLEDTAWRTYVAFLWCSPLSKVEADLQGRHARYGWQVQDDVNSGLTKFLHLSLRVVHRQGEFFWSCSSKESSDS